VPSALRAAGAKVVTHDEHFDADTPDEVWLAEAGGRGWIVLTQDQHIRYRATELRALTEAGVLAFVIVAAGATGAELGGLLGRALRRMSAVTASAQRPAVYLLRREASRCESAYADVCAGAASASRI
jgi:hypothetical protein